MSSARERRADAAHRARRERETAAPFCARHPKARVWVDSYLGATSRTCDGCFEEADDRRRAEHAADYPGHEEP